MKVWFMAVVVFLLVACQRPEPQPEPIAGEIVATLELAEGDVHVNGEGAEKGAGLREGDKVTTGADSKASVTFFDGGVLRLSENTEIVLSEVSKSAILISQTAGETWTRLLKLAGVDQYSVETPTTIASVRGTGFKVKVGAEETEISVGEGQVEVATKSEGRILKKQLLRKLQRASVRHGFLDQIRLAIATEAELGIELDQDEAVIDRLVRRFAERHPRIVRALREKGYTREDAERWIRDLATGELTQEQLREIAQDALQDLERVGIEIEDEQAVVEAEVDAIEQETVLPEETVPQEEPAVETIDEEPIEAPVNAPVQEELDGQLQDGLG